MPSSEELQLAFDVRLPQEKVDEAREIESNFNARVAKLAKHAKMDEWDDLGNLIHAINIEKGFWGDPVAMDQIVAKLMLVVTEVSEVVEALRKGQGAKAVTEEFADILIRTYDTYAECVAIGEADPHLYEVTMDKIETNKSRPVKHGNRWG